MTTPPKIKICGLTRASDVDEAVAAGVDYIGFVRYEPSPRYVDDVKLKMLSERLPSNVVPVLLFVNATAEKIQAALAIAPNALLQFHGDEPPAACAPYGRPFWKAARIPTAPGAEGFDLLQFTHTYAEADAVLLDAKIDAYGGGGKTFDWTAFPWSHPELNANRRLVLSGGLTPANVIDGIRTTSPWGVDVSSGVEQSKGIKDPGLMHAFCDAVRTSVVR